MYPNEKQGQIDFYDKLRMIDGTIPQFEEYSDGVVKGTILEFKLTISNTNAVLLQAIKYLSKMRNNGKDIPAQIMLVSLNDEKIYFFNSNDFLNEIETQYIGSASVNNRNFSTTIQPKIINYHNNLIEVINLLNNEDFIKVHIDLFCVVGYANRFYGEDSKRTKIDFFKELREPQVLNIYKWEGEEEDFKYIMDCLNDSQHKKELGAFYTPKEYVRLSTKLVRDAIRRIKTETTNDYIILDRCAGTGNLEQFLTDKPIDEITIGELPTYLDQDTINKYLWSIDKTTLLLLGKDKGTDNITLGELKEFERDIKINDYLFDSELSHCIVNTYELKEWIVLNRLIGDKVKMIIPPVENVKHNKSLVVGGDALSEYFITGNDTLDTISNDRNREIYSNCIKELNEYIQNPTVNVIVLENPPYRDDTTGNREGTMTRSYKDSYVKVQMKDSESFGAVVNDISNRFIWSALKYYLTKPNDFYILYSPVKYFKSCNLCNKTFIKGYILNRNWFHASPSAISLIEWQNLNKQQESFKLKAMDIDKTTIVNILNNNNNDNKEYKLYYINNNITIRKVYNVISELKDRRKFKTDIYENALICGSNGYEISKKDKMNFKPIYNDNILGYMIADRYTINYQSIGNITRLGQDAHAGFYLRADNYIKKLPLFCAKLYPQENWYERDVYFTTADKGEAYLQDTDLLKSCFIYTCLSRQNKCISFVGSDERFYRNQLCFDKDTIASKDLQQFTLDEDEQELLTVWQNILTEAKQTEEYNRTFSYGTYQIDMELNQDEYNNLGEKIGKKYTQLNTYIIASKRQLKQYYKTHIQEKLFKYELLK